MVRRYKLGRTEQRVPNLLRLLENQGMGALIYTQSGEPDPRPAAISSRHLRNLVMLAEKFEQDGAVEDDELSLLFQAGSSPGGARPKALVENESGAWLAKFAGAGDHLDVVSLEAAAMELARRAGIETPETRLMNPGTRKCLLVKRFDVNPKGGRNHLISMQSLLKADGYYNAGYRNLADVIKHVSADPQRDLQMLFRQMAFNVMIGNTDDHLKNFCMLYDVRGWKLSPAFDLLPNIGFNPEHVLRIGTDNRPPNLETLLSEAKHFEIKRRQKALDVVSEIREAMLGWVEVFAAYDVPEKDIDILEKDISHRLKRLIPQTLSLGFRSLKKYVLIL